MPDLFSTDVLNGIVRNLKVPRTGILDRYFPEVQTEDSEEIHFDRETGKRRISPFVSPLVEGQIVEEEGFQTDSFKPAYIKDKRPFDANRPFKRVIGEQLGGSLSPAARMEQIVAGTLRDQLNMLTRRFEWMAVKTLVDGKITIVGDKYPSKLVDFNRAAALDPADLTGTARWSESGSAPLDDLQTWSDLVAKEEGVAPVDVVLAVDVWKNFRSHADVKDRLDTRRGVGGGPLDLGAQLGEGMTFRGTIDGFNIFTYSGWYVDPADDTEKKMFPDGGVLMVGPVEGVRAYGAIRDHDTLIAMPWFVKSWLEDDPSVRFILLQSAPLMVPYRINATLAIDVLNGGA
ncbi:hypothetical protein LCGC14_1462700 [marine sediment metagenome]|uniref:Major capsid protein E n=1 Tax=marine sediment metagenome TaxID=412755 RepID=A0A0F9MGK8_9ZZZZ